MKGNTTVLLPPAPQPAGDPGVSDQGAPCRCGGGEPPPSPGCGADAMGRFREGFGRKASWRECSSSGTEWWRGDPVHRSPASRAAGGARRLARWPCPGRREDLRGVSGEAAKRLYLWGIAPVGGGARRGWGRDAGASFDHTRTVLHHGMPGFANRGAPEIKKVICRTRKPVWYGAILGHDG